MDSYEEHYAAVIAEITAAFEGVSREGGVSLSESWIIDNYGSDEKRAEARAKDSDTRWQEVPAYDIAVGYSCLSFLDNIGLRYYMPAYMTWSMKYFRAWNAALETLSDCTTLSEVERKSDSAESAIYALSVRMRLQDNARDERMDKWKLDRFKIFDAAQSRAIAHFLEFLADRHGEEGARMALSQYWATFL